MTPDDALQHSWITEVFSCKSYCSCLIPSNFFKPCLVFCLLMLNVANIFQSHQKGRPVHKVSQRKSVSRSSEGGSSFSRVTRVQNVDSSKQTTIPLKRAARTTDKLQPLFGDQKPAQGSTNMPVSPGILENDSSKKLVNLTSGLTLESEDCGNQRHLGQKQQSDNGGDQFLPPIK